MNSLFSFFFNFNCPPGGCAERGGALGFHACFLFSDFPSVFSKVRKSTSVPELIPFLYSYLIHNLLSREKIELYSTVLKAVPLHHMKHLIS